MVKEIKIITFLYWSHQIDEKIIRKVKEKIIYKIIRKFENVSNINSS